MNQSSILDLVTKEKDVTWKNMLTNLVKTNEMDPWDIDISILAKDFLVMLKELKQMDFRVSGKVILASAILLRMKSNILLTTYIEELDRMISSSQVNEFYDELEQEFLNNGIVDFKNEPRDYKLIPRTPQPRKRKVSIYDLMNALNKAIEVQDRRVIKKKFADAPIVEIPKKTYDLGELIVNIMDTIQNYYKTNQNTLTFSTLLTADSKKEKVMTFLPLLHLSNQRKINLEQLQHFGEIEIHLVALS